LSWQVFADLTNKVANDLHVGMVNEFLASPSKFEETLHEYEQQFGEKLGTTYEAMKEFMSKVATGEIVTEQTSKGWTIKRMFAEMLEMMPVLEAMQWGLLQAPQGELFLTSDCPMYVYDPGMLPPKDGKLLYSNEASFCFPINRSYALQGTFPAGKDVHQQLTPYEVRQFNRMTIARSYDHLYAPMRSEGLQLLMERVYKLRPPVLPNLPQSFRIT
jgi:hypothetical protein